MRDLELPRLIRLLLRRQEKYSRTEDEVGVFPEASRAVMTLVECVVVSNELRDEACLAKAFVVIADGLRENRAIDPPMLARQRLGGAAAGPRYRAARLYGSGRLSPSDRVPCFSGRGVGR
jgi:hypothetical protein